ncbi:hypothetical protein [Candidatus Clostridium radicumherbarum]|uniref:Uncharacterized protein n=1 Tax=Candidatus Clostridium radicumherbarum TaxID=3381662 RepID=A0ABW8TSX9_9CLOT
MKRRLIIPETIILVLAITSAILTYNGGRFKVPAYKDIKSVKIIPPTLGNVRLGEYKDLYFDLNKKEDKYMVNNILNWLKLGRIMGNASNEAISNGSTPAYFMIELKNGTEIFINSSVSEGYINNQKLIPSQNIKGQVTIRTNPSKREEIRLLSPELKSFIESGWKDFFDYTK